MSKNLDMIVANDVTRPGAGFDVDTNIVTLITRKGEQALPLMSKADVAGHILDYAFELYLEKGKCAIIAISKISCCDYSSIMAIS